MRERRFGQAKAGRMKGMMMRKPVALLVLPALLLPLLGACGQRANLVPQAGKELPPAPYGREQRPQAAELLETPTIAIPKRSVELRTRSEQREDDPFDLPPPEAVPSPTPTPTAAPTAPPTANATAATD